MELAMRSSRLAAITLLLGTVVPIGAAAQDLTESRRVEVARRLQESSVSIRVGNSGGSGFVAGEEQWIVTNAHVVQGFRYAPVVVQFGNGQQAQAEVMAYEPAHDLAVLRTQARPPIDPLPLANSDQVQVGQNVLAFGAPFGLQGTLTQGIVSARRDFPMMDGGTLRGVIQTDAPINPGNSGGPLVNSAGQVIAVNTAILSRTGGSHGIGFAVPSNYVEDLLRRLRAHVAQRGGSASMVGSSETTQSRTDGRDLQRVSSPVWLGILGDDYRGRGVAGVRIQRVIPGGPAAGAGLLGSQDPAPPFVQQLGVPWTGHIILAVDGRPVRSMEDLVRLLRAKRPGDRATVFVTVGPGVVSGEAVVQLVSPPSE